MARGQRALGSVPVSAKHGVTKHKGKPSHRQEEKRESRAGRGEEAQEEQEEGKSGRRKQAAESRARDQAEAGKPGRRKPSRRKPRRAPATRYTCESADRTHQAKAAPQEPS
jgi:hypothetical protein